MGEKQDLAIKDDQELKRLKDHREFDELVGYLKAANDFRDVIQQMLSVTQIEVIKKIIDNKIYKKAGYTLESFCKTRLGLSDDTVRAYVKFYEEFGSKFYNEFLPQSLPINAMENILRKKDAIDAIKKAEDKDRCKELQVQVEKLEKENAEYKKKHAFAEKWEKTAIKDREEKEKAIKDSESLRRKLEVVKGGITEDDIRIHNIGKTIKEKFDEIMLYFDYMPLEKKDYSDKTRIEILKLLEYMLDRLTIFSRIGQARWDSIHPNDPWPTTIEESGEWFLEKWGCGCLPIESNKEEA